MEKDKKRKDKTRPEKAEACQKKGWDKRKGFLLAALLIACIFLALTIGLRLYHGKPAFPLGESYYNMRIATHLNELGFFSQDPLQRTPYLPNPYHYALSSLLLLFGSYNALLLMQVALGLASAWLFFRLLVALGVDKAQATYSILVLAATPAFIVLFTGLYLLGWAVFLSLLSINLLLLKKSFFRIIGTLCLAMLALSSILGFIISALALAIILLELKRSLKPMIMPLIIPLIAIVALYASLGQAPKLLGFHGFSFKGTLSLLGASLGFDLFLLLIFIIGFIVLWGMAKKARIFHLAVLMLVVVSLFNSTARAFASFILSYYCVVAIIYLFKRKWSLELVKTGIMLLVLCSLVFSLANQVNMVVSSQPDKQMINALISLRELEGPGVVLADPGDGFLVEFYANKSVLLDGNSPLLDDYAIRSQASIELLNSVRIIDAQPLLEEYGIRYVLITPLMKQELWNDNERGLWFLSKNSDSFAKRYLENSIEIREYKPAAQLPVPG